MDGDTRDKGDDYSGAEGITMTNTQLKLFLRKNNACSRAVEWLGDRDLRTAWKECERGDWMLWLAGRAPVDRKALVKAACECAELVLPIYEKRYPKDTPRRAAEVLHHEQRGS